MNGCPHSLPQMGHSLQMTHRPFPKRPRFTTPSPWFITRRGCSELKTRRSGMGRMVHANVAFHCPKCIHVVLFWKNNNINTPSLMLIYIDFRRENVVFNATVIPIAPPARPPTTAPTRIILLDVRKMCAESVPRSRAAHPLQIQNG